MLTNQPAPSTPLPPWQTELRDRLFARRRSAAGIATWTLGLLAAVRAVDLLCWLFFTVGDDAMFAGSLGHAVAQLADAIDGSGVLLLLTAASGITFLVWFHRATSAALHHLGKSDASALLVAPGSPGGAVTSFFLPFANFYLPYRNMKFVVAASDPSALPLPVEMRDNPQAGYREPARVSFVQPVSIAPAPLAMWWASWIGGNLLSRMSHGSNTLLVVSVVILLVGNVYTIALVHAVERLQIERRRRLAALEPALSPGPWDAVLL